MGLGFLPCSRHLPHRKAKDFSECGLPQKRFVYCVIAGIVKGPKTVIVGIADVTGEAKLSMLVPQARKGFNAPFPGFACFIDADDSDHAAHIALNEGAHDYCEIAWLAVHISIPSIRACC
jgi:hypothetical protein